LDHTGKVAVQVTATDAGAPKEIALGAELMMVELLAWRITGNGQGSH